VFENGVLRIFGSKRGDAKGGRIKLHNKEFHDLHSSASPKNNHWYDFILTPLEAGV
jgi:hypothetical protein